MPNPSMNYPYPMNPYMFMKPGDQNMLMMKGKIKKINLGMYDPRFYMAMMSGMGGMGGMSAMPGMHPGMSMGGIPGMTGMAGIPGMTGIPGMPGMHQFNQVQDPNVLG